jgi:hypothetical protein
MFFKLIFVPLRLFNFCRPKTLLHVAPLRAKFLVTLGAVVKEESSALFAMFFYLYLLRSFGVGGCSPAFLGTKNPSFLPSRECSTTKLA